MSDAPDGEPAESRHAARRVRPHRRDAAASARRASRSRRAAAPTLEAIQMQLRAARSEFEHQVAHARDGVRRGERAHQGAHRPQPHRRDRSSALGLGAVLVALAHLLQVALRDLRPGGQRARASSSSVARAAGAAAAASTSSRSSSSARSWSSAAYFVDLWLHWVAALRRGGDRLVWRLLAQMIAKDGRTYGDVLERRAGRRASSSCTSPFLASLGVVLLAPGRRRVVGARVHHRRRRIRHRRVRGRPRLRAVIRWRPRISPKKTWEGFAGAVVAALVAGVLLALFMLGLAWWTGLVFGAVILGTATAGDLGESMIKRDLGIKDMSSWLPGHGGVLDRLDSILPSATAALALYYLLSPLVACMTTTGAASSRRRAPFPDARGRQQGLRAARRRRRSSRARATSFESATPRSAHRRRGRPPGAFPLVRGGYSIAAVDAALGRVEDAFAAREREREVDDARRPRRGSGRRARHAQEVLDRLARPKRRRFDARERLRYGYRIDEVDLVSDKLARYLETRRPVTVEQVRAVAFRMQRGGYREEQVDAVLDAVVDVMLAVR